MSMFFFVLGLPAKDTKAKQDASCAAYGCVGYTKSNDCQCNPSCAKWDSCCDDYEATCVAPPPPPMPPLAPGGCSVGAEGWPDVEVVCGECKALVDQFDDLYKTCTGYCEAVGRLCVDAWEESADSCTVKYDADCDTEIASSDAMCECGAELPAGKARKAKKAVAKNSTALPAAKAKQDASCAAYGCVGYTKSNDCQCNPSCAKWDSCCDDYEATCVAPPPPPMPPLAPGGCSVGAEEWPDVEVVCGECKALVDQFDDLYKTCTGYCEAVGRMCVDAWEESADSCTVKYDADCDTEIASSDAMCECGAELPASNWSSKKAKAEHAMQAA